MPPAYVVITPARNESRFLGSSIDSMAAQTVLPRRWVIVDDGSTDGTDAIAEAAARNCGWITARRRPDRGFRKSGGGVVEAFYDGYAVVAETAWDFVVKLDADLAFPPTYFQACLEHFERDRQLGIAGGAVSVLDQGTPRVESPGDPPFHVRGATKIYRRACWADVHPLAQGPGWDTIDEVRANMRGWATRTFLDIPVIQQRATGAVDGDWANALKNGAANYATGYHPAFMAAKCLKRVWSNGGIVSAAGLWAGFCSGYLRRQPRLADLETVRYLRRQQLRRLALRPSIYHSRWPATGEGAVGR